MRQARCAAATASASKTALRKMPDSGAACRPRARRARRDHSPQRNARRAAGACRRPADGGDRCRDAMPRVSTSPRRRRRMARPDFFASLSPRTLAVAASFADARDRAAGLHDRRHFHQAARCGARSSLATAPRIATALLRWCASREQASAAEITNFLQNYQAALVDGPTPGGLYRVRIAMTRLPRKSWPHRRADAAGAGRGIRRAGRIGRPDGAPTRRLQLVLRLAPGYLAENAAIFL